MVVATEHRIVSSDGASTVVDEYLPPEPSADPAAADEAILFLPALGVPVSYYRPMLEAWAARGRRLFALEVRGRPRSSTSDVRRNDFGYATIIERDLPAVLAQTPLGGIRRLTLVGHSLGGQLALLSTGAGMLHPERIVAIASGSTKGGAHLRLRERIGRRLVTPTAVAISQLLGYFPGHRLGFGDRQPKTMIADWHREAWHGRFRFAGTAVDYEEALRHIEVPVLAVSFDGDRLVPHGSTDLLMSRVGPAVPERLRLTAADNSGAVWDHVRWSRQNAGAVLDGVERWLARAA